MLLTVDECEKLLQYQEDNCTAIKKRGQAYCLLHLFDQVVSFRLIDWLGIN